MDHLKALVKSYITPSRKAISPEYYFKNTLPGLPTELLQQICDFLTVVDLVCLCICNHRLHAIFRRYYRLPSLRKDKLSIFARLERDLPEYFACDICNILHRYDGSESFGLSGLVQNRTCRLPCIRKGDKLEEDWLGDSSISMRTHSRFSHPRNRICFLQIKLAMRRFHYGPGSGINIASLSFTQVDRYRHPFDTVRNNEFKAFRYPPIETLFSIQAQIFPEPPGVYIRMQDIVLLGKWEDSKINSPWSPLENYEVCRHISLQSKAADLESIYDGRKDFFSYTCRKCNTESLVEIRRLGSRVALIMTRWVNLGPGRDKEDPLWKIHIHDSYAFPEQLEDSLITQSPRVCFEDMAPLSFEDLRSRNLSYLCNERYKKGKPFVRQERGVYHISYKEPSKIRRILSMCSRSGRLVGSQ